MHSLILKLFNKKGIKATDELSEEEKRDFDNWQRILNKEKLSIEDIEQFCRSQCETIKQKWSDYNIEQAKKSELIPYFTVYNTLLAAISSPQVEREALERQLIELTK